MVDNVQLPGTGQIIAAKADPSGVDHQEVILADKSFTDVNPATADNQDEILRVLKTTEDETGIADLIQQLTDQSNGIKLQVQLPTNLNQDIAGSLIQSDMPKLITWTSATASQPCFIDCTGYDSIFVHKITTGVVTPYFMNDNNTQSACLAVAVSTGVPAATLLTAAGMYVIPVTGKILKLVGPASVVQCFIYQSATPYPMNIHMLSAALQNMTQYGSNNVVTAGVNGMAAVGGNIAAGTAPTANPVSAGGQDQLTTPLTRRFLTDVLGRQIVGNVPSQNSKAYSPLNYDPTYRNILEVQDTNRSDDGQSLQDLNLAILQELKMLNHQIYELSKAMQTGQTLSDEPNRLREDMTIFN